MKIIQIGQFIRRIVLSFSFGIQILVYIFVTIIFLELGPFFGIIFEILGLIFFIYFKINFLPFLILSFITIFQFNEKNINLEVIKNFENKNIEISGKIINYPSQNSRENQIAKLEIFKINGVLIKRGVITKIESYDFKNEFDYLDSVRCIGKLENEYEATKAYFMSENLIGEISCESTEIAITKDNSNLVKDLIKSRRGLLQKVNSNLNRPYKDLFLGMILGSDEQFSRHLKNDIVNTGTSHLIAASGFNINLVFLMAFTLSGKMEKWKLILLSDLFLIIYIFIVGFDNIPAKRALIMQVYLTTAWLFGKKANTFYSLVLSCLFMFLENIYVYKSLSFILSFFATLGIAMFYKRAKDFLTKIIRNEWLSSLIAISVVANIATIPVLLMVFGKMSLISIFINILISPLIPIIFYLGFAFISLLVIGVQSLFLNYIMVSILNLIIKAIDYFGSQNYAILNVNINPIVIIFFLIIIISIWGIGFYKEYNHG